MGCGGGLRLREGWKKRGSRAGASFGRQTREEDSTVSPASDSAGVNVVGTNPGEGP